MENENLEQNLSCGCGHDHEHSDSCDCGHDHEHPTMKLQLEDGSNVECTVIDIFGVEGFDGEYISLLPLDSDEVLIYKYNEFEDGSFELLNIETDEEFEAVEEAFFSEIDDELDVDEEFVYDDEDEDE